MKSNDSAVHSWLLFYLSALLIFEYYFGFQVLDEQKLTCPTLKRFAIEMVTTKVTIILDKIKKKILASTNQTSAKGPVDTNNTTLPSGIGKETYEMYRPSYAQTLHSLIKVSIWCFILVFLSFIFFKFLAHLR